MSETSDVISIERQAEIAIYLDQVERGSKPAADLGVWSGEDMDAVLEEILYLTNARGLQIYVEEVEEVGKSLIFVVYVYKYRWVEDLLDFLIKEYETKGTFDVVFHIISGLMYGYAGDSIEEFVARERQSARCRAIVRRSEEEE